MTDQTTHEPAANVRGLTFVSRAFSFVACVLLFAMMVITFVDVIGRYVFLAPLPAAYEIISLMMPAIIFCALPLTVLRNGHVTIDLLDAMTPAWVVPIRDLVVALFSAAALALVSWRLVVRAQDAYAYEDVSDQLWIPLWPFSAGMAVLCAIATLCALALAVLAVQRMFNR